MNIAAYLLRHGVPFETIEHPTTYTAMEMAESIHVKGCQIAKTVLLKAEDGFLIAVLPSTHRVDLSAIEDILGMPQVWIASERDAIHLFPDMEAGVVPPFGSEYGLRTFVDIHLAGCKKIVFEGNSHHEAISLAFEDYEMLEQPSNALISTPMHTGRRRNGHAAQHSHRGQ